MTAVEGLEVTRLEMGKASEEEFCAIIQVAKPRLGGTKERGEPGGGMDASWP